MQSELESLKFMGTQQRDRIVALEQVIKRHSLTTLFYDIFAGDDTLNVRYAITFDHLLPGNVGDDCNVPGAENTPYEYNFSLPSTEHSAVYLK